jgi:thiol:disulfide interchange protein DsbC
MPKIVVSFLLAFSCAILLQARSQPALSFGGCEEDCQKCHSLSPVEAQEILKKLNRLDARVAEVKMSPIRGLWEVVAVEKGTRGVLYVGFSKKHVVGGPIVEVEAAAGKTREAPAPDKRPAERFVDPARVTLEDSLVMGDPGAPLKVVVYTDPDCPFCGRLHGELKKVLETRSDIAFFLKLFPLKIHPDAHWKSRTILCDGSLRFLEENFEKRQIPRPDCEAPGVERNIQTAAELGITGTPTLIMPDGLVVPGAPSATALVELIQKHPRKGR